MSQAVTRRAALALPAQLAITGVLGAAAGAELDLEYRDGRLAWPGDSTRAAAGRAGVVVDKREGDGATPAGTFPLIMAYCRGDRLSPPRTKLRVKALAPRDAWCDDPPDRNYNRHVSLPYPAHTEALWLDDEVYDLLVVVGYNTAPVVPGAGSAIFLHIARPDFSPTAGCIAIARAALLDLVSLLGPNSRIAIHN